MNAPVADRTGGPQGAWVDRDGHAIACREKLVVLAENEAELMTAMRDTFEDAVLMGVDEAALRTRLHALVERLASPLAR